MKVIYYHQHYNTPAGIVGVRSYQMAKALIAHGHEVTMVCGSYTGGVTGLDGPFRGGKRRGMVDGIDIVEFDLRYSNNDGFLKRSLTFLRFAAGAIMLALRERYDVAFATTTPLTAGIPAIVARWLRGKRYVFEVRDLWPELPRAMGVIRNPLILGALSVLEWLSYRNADRCVALAPGIAEGIAARGVPAERIALLPNGCDFSIFDVGAPPWRPEGIGPERLLALYSGTHGQANGLDAVLDAARVLKERRRDDIALVLIGEGKLKSGLVARARAEGLDNVHFHDPVGKTLLAGLMAEADIGLQILANIPAFYYGTSPNKFFDYLAAGLPVLTNYPGWVADMIVVNGAGFAVPPGQPDALADALVSAANDRSSLGPMRAAARDIGRRDFARDTLADGWVDWVTKGIAPAHATALLPAVPELSSNRSKAYAQKT